jgi:hypothetical protein
MRKMAQRFLMVALVLTVALPWQVVAVSDAGRIEPPQLRYSYTTAITAVLSISGGVANCSGTIDPISGCSASIRVVLYRSVDGNSWSEIASWSGSAGSGLSANANGSKPISSGYKYKVTSFGTIKNSSGTVVESPSKTTAVKTY